jgi:GNAT superfamily N-acetyltransferase
MENIPEKLITTYLEMTDQAQFRPAYLDDPASVTILPMTQPDVVYYQFLYRAVGEVWRWRDRLLISDDELLEILSAPGLTVDVLYVEGVPAGYVELLREGANTEIAYFGLRPAFIGRGLGKHLLSYGIEQAWQGGAERVWLHTCNLDGPHALSNYQKRGFSVYKVEEVPMPERFQ